MHERSQLLEGIFCLRKYSQYTDGQTGERGPESALHINPNNVAQKTKHTFRSTTSRGPSRKKIWRKILKWKCNKWWEGDNSTVSEKQKQRNVRQMRLGAVLAASHSSPTLPEAQNSWTNGSSVFQSSFPMAEVSQILVPTSARWKPVQVYLSMLQSRLRL